MQPQQTKVIKAKRSSKPFIGIILFIAIVVGIVRYNQAPLTVTPVVQDIQVTTPAATQFDWPTYGQAAVATKDYGVLSVHGSEAPQSTASTAKLITMLAVLHKKPFDDQKGETITFSSSDVDSYEVYVAGNGSVVPVQVGLTWTQYQAMEAVLLASANNVADSLAVWAFGSLESYREYAQNMVQEIGMSHTTIGTDASGYSATTISTASDLALLATKVLQEPMLRSIVGTSAVELPGAGTVKNTNYLLAEGDVIGMKTGWTPEAGGVFVLAGKQTLSGHEHEIVTVVMGAPGSTSSAAQDAAYELFQSAKNNFSYQEVLATTGQVGFYHPLWSKEQISLKPERSVGMIVWAGKSPEVNVTANDHQPSEGGVSGTIRITYGAWSTEVSAVLEDSIPEPSLWWRVIGRG